jgi:hypothetical protein
VLLTLIYIPLLKERGNQGYEGYKHIAPPEQKTLKQIAPPEQEPLKQIAPPEQEPLKQIASWKADPFTPVALRFPGEI